MSPGEAEPPATGVAAPRRSPSGNQIAPQAADFLMNSDNSCLVLPATFFFCKQQAFFLFFFFLRRYFLHYFVVVFRLIQAYFHHGQP